MAELQKCPFCGGEANVITYAGAEKIVYMQCNGCKVLMGFPRIVISERKGKLYFESEAELIEAWNNRATEAEIRAKVLNEAMERLARAICAGCGYLKDCKCTYKGSNCGVSQPMLEKTMVVLDQLKEEQ